MQPSSGQSVEVGPGAHLVAECGEVSLAYETFGDPSDPTMLLIMGLGMQLLGWDEELCALLADRGFHVLRFDNRDVGLSTKLGGRRVNLTAGMLGLTGSAAYTVEEMAADTAGLIDHLGPDRVHVVGASMGGMIAQKLAARHPERVLSLCSIMSGSGRRRPSMLARPDAMRALFRRPATSRNAYVEEIAELMRRIGSPAFPTDPERLRQRAAAAWDRSFYPAGVARQLMAVMASGDRTAELRTITAPTLVIHGSADRLIPAPAGRQVARAIPGARYEEIEGMGHDLPIALWPQLVELIIGNAARAG